MQHPPTLRLGPMPHLQCRARLADSTHPFEQHATAAGQGLQPRKDRLGLGVGALLRSDERQHLRPQVATKPGEAGAVFAVAQHQGGLGLWGFLNVGDFVAVDLVTCDLVTCELVSSDHVALDDGGS